MGLSVILLISVISNALLLRRTQSAANFTVVPPSTLYVSVGETAKLVWDYTVDNRNEEFDMFSPRWIFYADNGSAYQIAQENIFNKRKWFINRASCPARLLNPVRVSKQSTATLVIHNVTLADSGTYGCVLVLTARSPITSKVKLVVTSYPIITLHLSPPSISMNASRDFFINCSALGTPTPNVTWQTVQGKVIDQGVGKAIINSTNFTGDDSEVYECCANNNPNMPGGCKKLTKLISVKYNQEIDVRKTCASNNRSQVMLRCNASGVSSPQFAWYDTSNRKISKILRNAKAGSFLELLAIDEDRYGLYKCNAETILVCEENIVNVTQTVPTFKSIATVMSTTKVTFSTPKVHQDKSSPFEKKGINIKIILLAAGGSVTFVLLTTIFIAVLIYKKHSKNKDKEAQESKNQVPSLPLDAAETTMPVYATVDLTKKKKNRSQGDVQIYAQVDKSRKKRPHQIIYAELDEMHLDGVFSSTSPPRPMRNSYDEIDGIQSNKSKTENTDPIYACIQLE